MYEGIEKGEQDKARRIIRRALALGLAVSVFDGDGGWEVTRSRDEDAIWDAIGNMDTDQLILRNAAGEPMGWLLLVWGNAPDGSELAANYTDNSIMAEIVSA